MNIVRSTNRYTMTIWYIKCLNTTTSTTTSEQDKLIAKFIKDFGSTSSEVADEFGADGKVQVVTDNVSEIYSKVSEFTEDMNRTGSSSADELMIAFTSQPGNPSDDNSTQVWPQEGSIEFNTGHEIMLDTDKKQKNDQPIIKSNISLNEGFVFFEIDVITDNDVILTLVCSEAFRSDVAEYKSGDKTVSTHVEMEDGKPLICSESKLLAGTTYHLPKGLNGKMINDDVIYNENEESLYRVIWTLELDS